MGGCILKFGDKLKERRRWLGMTQDDLANELGVTRRTIIIERCPLVRYEYIIILTYMPILLIMSSFFYNGVM